MATLPPSFCCFSREPACIFSGQYFLILLLSAMPTLAQLCPLRQLYRASSNTKPLQIPTREEQGWLYRSAKKSSFYVHSGSRVSSAPGKPGGQAACSPVPPARGTCIILTHLLYGVEVLRKASALIYPIRFSVVPSNCN